jgi:hypothetical protein
MRLGYATIYNTGIPLPDHHHTTIPPSDFRISKSPEVVI